MNKFDTKPQNMPFAMATASPPDASTSIRTRPVSASRLIVLVPSDLEYSSLTRRVWELAITTGKHVQLLGLCQDIAEEPSLRRQLVSMSALVGDTRVTVEAKVEIGTWLNLALGKRLVDQNGHQWVWSSMHCNGNGGFCGNQIS